MTCGVLSRNPWVKSYRRRMEQWLEHERDGLEVFAEVSLHQGCKSCSEDGSSWIPTLGLDSMRNDEGEEGRTRLIGSGEHTRHPHRSSAERKRHNTDPRSSPTAGALHQLNCSKHTLNNNNSYWWGSSTGSVSLKSPCCESFTRCVV